MAAAYRTSPSQATNALRDFDKLAYEPR